MPDSGTLSEFGRYLHVQVLQSGISHIGSPSQSTGDIFSEPNRVPLERKA